ncbi:hypothetical protein GCM10010441_75500 [Kitasatospora paracochleata]
MGEFGKGLGNGVLERLRVPHLTQRSARTVPVPPARDCPGAARVHGSKRRSGPRAHRSAGLRRPLRVCGARPVDGRVPGWVNGRHFRTLVRESSYGEGMNTLPRADTAAGSETTAEQAATHIPAPAAAGDERQPRAADGAGEARLGAAWNLARQGDHEAALAAFRQLAGERGPHRRDAQVGVIEQLYDLGLADEGDTACSALRTDLDADPDQAALRIYRDMVELLTDQDRPEQALRWCEAALLHAPGEDTGQEHAPVVDDLRLSRALLRQGLDLDLDDQDLAALDVGEDALDGLGRLLLDGIRPPGPAEHRVGGDGEAFDGIVLHWRRADFDRVRARWPETTRVYGDDYASYTTLVQAQARDWSERGAAHVRLVPAALADYEAWAVRVGRDPADPAARRDYSRWLDHTAPEHSLVWPPARNGPCWCDSGTKYKKCCGAPARN